MKRTLSIILSLVMLFSVLPLTVSAAEVDTADTSRTAKVIEDFYFKADFEAIALKSNVTAGAWLSNLNARGGIQPDNGEQGWKIGSVYGIYDESAGKYLNDNEYPNLSHTNSLRVSISITDDNYAFSRKNHTYGTYVNGVKFSGDILYYGDIIGIRLKSAVWFTDISISVPKPTAGAATSSNAPKVNTSHVNLVGYEWKEYASESDYNNNPSSGTTVTSFKTGKYYRVTIKIKEDDGYVIPVDNNDCLLTVNGEKCEYYWPSGESYRETSWGYSNQLSNCKITFDSNGGSDTMDSITVTKGSAYRLPDCGFTAPANKVFKNWKIGNKFYDPGYTITITGDTTVYAQWYPTATVIEDFHFKADPEAIALKSNVTAGSWLANLNSKGGLKVADGEKGWRIGNVFGIYDQSSGKKLDDNEYPNLSHTNRLRFEVFLTGDDYVFSRRNHTYATYVNGFGAGGDVISTGNVTSIYLNAWAWITNVEISVPKPTAGATVTNCAPTVNTTHVKLAEYEWKEYASEEAYNNNPSSGTKVTSFKNDKYYRVEITLDADDGYYIPNEPNTDLCEIKINDERCEYYNSGDYTYTSWGVSLQVPKCTITFDKNGGTGTMNPVTINKGSSYKLPECGFTAPENKKFKYWKIGNTFYSPGESFTVTSDLTAYAYWINTSGIAERVDISVTLPKAGELPSYDAAVYGSGNVITGNEVPVSGSPGVYTQYKGVLWRDMTTRKNQRSNAAFVDGHEYRVSVDLKSLAGTNFNFEDDSKPMTQIYINGSAAEVQPAATDNTICTAMYTFSCNSGFTVSGSYTSYLDSYQATKIELLQNETMKYATASTGNSGSYSIPNVASGSYTLRVSKKNHVTRDYEITVSGNTTQDVKIHPLGDISGDGKITTKDSAMANAHAMKTSLLSDYPLKCGDVLKGDGKITTADASRINAAAMKTQPLW